MPVILEGRTYNLTNILTHGETSVVAASAGSPWTAYWGLVDGSGAARLGSDYSVFGSVRQILQIKALADQVDDDRETFTIRVHSFHTVYRPDNQGGDYIESYDYSYNFEIRERSRMSRDEIVADAFQKARNDVADVGGQPNVIELLQQAKGIVVTQYREENDPLSQNLAARDAERFIIGLQAAQSRRISNFEDAVTTLDAVRALGVAPIYETLKFIPGVSNALRTNSQVPTSAPGGLLSLFTGLVEGQTGSFLDRLDTSAPIDTNPSVPIINPAPGGTAQSVGGPPPTIYELSTTSGLSLMILGGNEYQVRRTPTLPTDLTGAFVLDAQGGAVTLTSGEDMLFSSLARYAALNGGADLASVTAAGAFVDGGAGDDVIVLGDEGGAADGGAGDDTLVGGALADTLLGGPGLDLMRGYGGDDVYGVDAPVDQIVEMTAGGFDTVYASVSYTLPENVEAGFLTGGAGAANLTGNASGNALLGNSFANVLTGGAGDDVYGVNGNIDVVVEVAGDGYDEVYASADFTLSANVETLFLTGTAIYGTGNDANNAIIGNAQNNILSAGAGSYEFLNGGAGDDILIGGAGHDELFGSTGADMFRFTAVGDVFNGASNDGDTLLDFQVGVDHVQLNAAAFGLNQGVVAGETFFSGSSPAATKPLPTLLYNDANGALFYDPDGTGPQSLVVLALIAGAPGLGVGDFVLY